MPYKPGEQLFKWIGLSQRLREQTEQNDYNQIKAAISAGNLQQRLEQNARIEKFQKHQMGAKFELQKRKYFDPQAETALVDEYISGSESMGELHQSLFGGEVEPVSEAGKYTGEGYWPTREQITGRSKELERSLYGGREATSLPTPRIPDLRQQLEAEPDIDLREAEEWLRQNPTHPQSERVRRTLRGRHAL